MDKEHLERELEEATARLGRLRHEQFELASEAESLADRQAELERHSDATNERIDELLRAMGIQHLPPWQ